MESSVHGVSIPVDVFRMMHAPEMHQECGAGSSDRLGEMLSLPEGGFLLVVLVFDCTGESWGVSVLGCGWMLQLGESSDGGYRLRGLFQVEAGSVRASAYGFLFRRDSG